MFSMQQAIRSIVVGAVLARERWQSVVAYNPLSRAAVGRRIGYLAMDVALRILTQCERLLDKGRGFEPTGD